MLEAGSKEEIVQYSSWQLAKDILELIKPYRGRFWFASLIRMLGDLAWLYPAFAFASIVTFLTEYRPGESFRTLWIVLGLWLAATVVRSLSQFFSKFLGYRVAERLSIDSTLKTVRHLFRLDMAWHERENSGNKIKRIQNAGDGFNKILRLWFNNTRSQVRSATPRRYALHTSNGVWKSRTFRGLLLRRSMTNRRSSDVTTEKSVPFGKYCRTKPLVFSPVPR